MISLLARQDSVVKVAVAFPVNVDGPVQVVGLEARHLPASTSSPLIFTNHSIVSNGRLAQSTVMIVPSSVGPGSLAKERRNTISSAFLTYYQQQIIPTFLNIVVNKTTIKDNCVLFLNIQCYKCAL